MVAYLRSLNEVETSRLPPMFREHEGGFTKYWLEDGEVRWRDITAFEFPKSGWGSGGRMSALETLLSATRGAVGGLLETLVAEAGRLVPDLNSIERAILEDLDSQLPVPVCERCGLLGDQPFDGVGQWVVSVRRRQPACDPHGKGVVGLHGTGNSVVHWMYPTV